VVSLIGNPQRVAASTCPFVTSANQITLSSRCSSDRSRKSSGLYSLAGRDLRLIFQGPQACGWLAGYVQHGHIQGTGSLEREIRQVTRHMRLLTGALPPCPPHIPVPSTSCASGRKKKPVLTTTSVAWREQGTATNTRHHTSHALR